MSKVPVGGKKIQPVKGNTGIVGGGASHPNSKSFKGLENTQFAPPAKTYVPCGHKGTGGKL
jgi:hypothetical protein